MPRAAVELDLFGLDNHRAKYRPAAAEQRNSIRGIQSAISRINPQILKSVFDGTNYTSTPSAPALPLLNPASRTCFESSPAKAPLTIFYNGTVTVFDVPQDTAESIIRMAEKGNNVKEEGGGVGVGCDEFLLDKLKLNGDLPIARKKSLQRFIEKRKERLTHAAPYAISGGDLMMSPPKESLKMVPNF